MRTTNHAFVNQLLIYTLFTICFSGSIGLGTVWMRHQISLTANASRVLESRIAELDRHIAETATVIETQQDPALLKKLNSELRLGLVPPALGQITSVTEDPAMHLATKRNRGLRDRDEGSVYFNLGEPPARHIEGVAALPVSASFGKRIALKN